MYFIANDLSDPQDGLFVINGYKSEDAPAAFLRQVGMPSNGICGSFYLCISYLALTDLCAIVQAVLLEVLSVHNQRMQARTPPHLFSALRNFIYIQILDERDNVHTCQE